MLVISSLDTHTTTRVLEQLRLRNRRDHITLLAPPEVSESFAATDSIDRVRTYTRMKSTLSTAATLLGSLRKERFDLFVLLCRDLSKTSHLRNVILFSFLLHCRRRVLLDTTLASRDIEIKSKLGSALDALSFVGVGVAKILTLVLVSASKTLGARDSLDSHDIRTNVRERKIAVLLPILPDLSHTFLYREVLAMRNQGAEFDLFALERGDDSIMHPEARALLENAFFVPKISQTRYLLIYLFFLIRHPVRLTKLLSLYKSNNLGDMCLLDVGELHNPLHPIQGLSLAWELRRREISYVHTYGSTYPATRVIVASLLLAVPFSVSTYVDFDFDYSFKMFRCKMDLARFVVATTRFCANRILSYTSEEVSKKVHVIHLGIDRDHCRNFKDKFEIDTEESPCIVAVGRFVEKKGFDYLVKACALLKARGLTTRCVMIGDGPDREKLRSLIEALGIQNEVELSGPVPNDQLIEFLKPHDIMVAPSVYASNGERDGIPTVLLEAMLCRIPVISTTISGIPELITDGLDGLLVPDRDETALADAIEKLLRDADLRKRFGKNGRQRVLQDFDIKKSASRLWSLIKSQQES